MVRMRRLLAASLALNLVLAAIIWGYYCHSAEVQLRSDVYRSMLVQGWRCEGFTAEECGNILDQFDGIRPPAREWFPFIHWSQFSVRRDDR
jgi:hypothetical protein